MTALARQRLHRERQVLSTRSSAPRDSSPRRTRTASSLILRRVGVQDTGEIERALTAFARSADSGLIVTASALASVHVDRIVALVGRLKLPTVYPYSNIVTRGALVSYGPDLIDQFRRAAG